MSKFTDLTFATADQRRPFAKKVGQHLPADFANLLAGMARHNDTGHVPAPDTRTAVNATVPVLPRMRVLTALVEPNTLALARNMSLFLPCRTETAEDGAFVTSWASPAEHAQATRKVYEHYLHTHESVRDIGAGSPTDSWHSPMLLAPVRHSYRDGSDPVAALVAVDGTARVFGARVALAADLTGWHVDKTWADAGALWPLTMAAARDVVAAARINSRVTGVLETGTDPGRGAPAWAASDGSIEDWADILLPDPARHLNDLGLYLYHVHNTPEASQELERLFPDTCEEWVSSIDMFTGRDPFTLMGLSPANAEDRDEVTATETEFRRHLLTVVSNKDVTARRITLAGVAAIQQSGTQPVFTDPDTTNMFTNWLSVALSKTRRLDYLAARSIMSLIRDLNVLRPFPDCDLYGIEQDLSNPELGYPLNDPTSDWFTITALRGLTYAILHGHLTGQDIPHSEAYQAAVRAESDAYDAAYAQAEADDADPDEATEHLPDLTGAPEFEAEMRDRILFAQFPDNLIDRLFGTPEGHAVILAYAQHATQGTIPEDLFDCRATTGGQRVVLVAPDTTPVP